MEIIIMAQLSSPGVSVTVEDESFYTSAGAGTIPLIFVASASNKLNGSKTGIAPGTLAKNDGKVYLLTSQKDLIDTFGTPVFKTDTSNNPIHAGEQNEYGLQAAYSYLGVSNRAYVARASVDLEQLNGQTTIPGGVPADGTVWLETHSTQWGLFSWNSALQNVPSGQTFTNIVPLVITDVTKVLNFAAGDYTPKASIGSSGNYAIVAVSSLIKLWYKTFETFNPAGTWVEVGSPDWTSSIPTVKAGKSSVEILSTDSISVNDTIFTGHTSLEDLVIAINSSVVLSAAGISAAEINNTLEIYSTGVAVNLDGTSSSTAAKFEFGFTVDTNDSTIFKAPVLQISGHTEVPLFKRKDAINADTVNGIPTGSIWVKITNVNKGADIVVSKYSAKTASWVGAKAPIYANGRAALAGLDPTGGGINIAGNTLYVKYNVGESVKPYASFKMYRRADVTATTIESGIITVSTFPSGDYSFKIKESQLGSTVLLERTVSFNVSNNETVTNIIQEILTKINIPTAHSNVHAELVGASKIRISHIIGGDIEFEDIGGKPLKKLFDPASTINFYQHSNDEEINAADLYIASLWSEYNVDRDASFVVPSDSAPLGNPADGQIWYDANRDDVDIMVKDEDTWRAYRNVDHGQGEGATDPKGPIISASRPKLQSDKTALVDGDLWIDTSDEENYPQIYRYNNFPKEWQLIDKSDQTTEHGILFADARWNNSGVATEPSTIHELLGGFGLSDADRAAADFLDFDAPNPKLYPKGMLLWNLRRSGFNVKRFAKNHVNVLDRNLRFNSEAMVNYHPNTWISEAANNEDGSGAFGRFAQRKVVVQSLQALVNTNQQIRDEESRVFNLLAAPGYPELVGEMKILNYDRGITAFVVADTPARLTPDATSLSNWGSNASLVSEDGDKGLVASDEYMAFFYPWGITSDNLGNKIVVPPSYMMLRTIALNDNVSYPWFAPAGTSRGVINNADAVGYIDKNKEWQTVALNTGQRDTLASIKVNPITFIQGSGFVNFGQYTRASNASSLDRINVARLVVYLRRQFSLLSRPYLFQPNDEATRRQIKHAAESMLVELMGQRALYDFVVVCDTTNNTPARIDRSELYLDVAIEPTKAVEFIYIPLRLKNTGEIKTLG